MKLKDCMWAFLWRIVAVPSPSAPEAPVEYP